MRNEQVEFWTNLLLFLLGAAGFVGLFLSWPLMLCILMMAVGWGIIFIVNCDGNIDF